MNLKVVEVENFYKALNPNITTGRNGIQYFNSSDRDEDNAMPQLLLDLKQKSSVHSNLLNLKSSLIYASGLYPVEETNADLLAFLKSKNRVGDSVQKVFKKCANDMATFEQCYVEIIYNAEGNIAELYHKPFNYIRAGLNNEFGIPDFYYYSTTWGDISNQRYKKRRNDIANAIPIAAFNPNTIMQSGGKQIIHIKKYDSSEGVYNIPSYLSGQDSINNLYAINQYVNNKLNGGYFLDGFLHINTTMPDEDKEKFVREFELKYKGANSKNKIVFLFGDTAVAKPEFVPIQDTLSNSIFRDYVTQFVKEICFSHGASLNLLGLSNSDSFGSSNPDSNDINVSRLEYIANVVKSFQDDLLEGFNKLFEVNGLGEATLLNDTLKLTIPELQPGDTTVDERREIVLGLEPIGVANTNPPTNPLA